MQPQGTSDTGASAPVVSTQAPEQAARRTPWPWLLSSESTARVQRIVGQNADGRVLIAKCEGHLAHIGGENLANAEFIVRACNVHDDLVAALRALRADISKLRWGQSYPGRNHALMDSVDVVLAKAAGDRTDGSTAQVVA